MWNLEGFYALVLFFTIFIIITTCLMVICEYNHTDKSRSNGSIIQMCLRVLQCAGPSSRGRSRARNAQSH